MKKKIFYEKPAIEVVELKQTGVLMSSGGLGGNSMDGTFTEEDLAREFSDDLNFFEE